MKPTRRGFPALLGAAVVSTAIVAVTAAGAPAQATPTQATPTASASPMTASHVVAPVPALNWQPCGPGLEPFLCATAAVPTDYDDPSGPKTRLALTKLPASGPPQQRLGALFTNPGGPGGRASTSSRRVPR